MKIKRWWTIALVSMSTAASMSAACSGSTSELNMDQDEGTTQVDAELRSDKAPTQTAVPGPRIAAMELQLLTKTTGRLAVRLTEASNQELTRAGVFTLTSNADDKTSYTFNDQGKTPDTKARDGLWSTQVPVNLDFISQVNKEATSFKLKSIDRYDYATGFQTGSVKIPSSLLDLTALKKGANIAFLPLTAMGLLQTTGAAFTGPVVADNSLIINALSVVENPRSYAQPVCGSPNRRT
jgi:hypothetical protein